MINSDYFHSIVPSSSQSTSGINATVNFRGVPIALAFPVNSSALSFAIPSLGVQQQFNGGSRGASLTMLKDYLLKNSGDFTRRFEQALIKSSPNDPTAGNPNSLQSSMIAQDFSNAGFDTTGVGDAISAGAGSAAASAAANAGNKVFVGLQAGTFTAQGVTGKTITAPLSYTIRFDRDPRYQLQFGLPVTYIEQAGAKTAAAAFSVGFQFPLLAYESRNQWYLAPRASVGATGSADAAAASILSNFSLTSRYVMPLTSKDQLTIANMVAYNMSIPFKIQSFNGDYGIKNVAFKNGLLYRRNLDFRLFGSSGTAIQASYAFTYFTGTDLYMNSYHEMALTVGTIKHNGAPSLLRFGVNGALGRQYQKIAASLGYVF
ncbi:hypothetical protein [Novosphingobium rosa]|uniref:hypothetical protein n=1 Tax=Novosphingobium rosa TaxID=76978 RepID=UPI00082F5A9F|nr:hypothetical protein [Novosphingobium rosa]